MPRFTPLSKAAEVCVFRGRVRRELQRRSLDLFVVFSSYFFPLHSFLPVHSFPQDFPFHQRNTINHDFHLLRQTLYPHLSHLNPHPKTLTAHHYLLVYFLINGNGDDKDWEKVKGSKGGD